MELDFGIDVYATTDYLQDYSQYANDHDAISEVDSNWYIDQADAAGARNDSTMVDNEIETAMYTVRKPKINIGKRQKRKVESIIEPGQMFVKNTVLKLPSNAKKWCSPVMKFYLQLLNWTVQLMKLNSRSDLRLRPMLPFSPNFESPTQYFDLIAAVIIEECRASIAAELVSQLSKSSSSVEFMILNLSEVVDELTNYNLQGSNSGLLCLECEIKPGQTTALHSLMNEQLRPGSIFAVQFYLLNHATTVQPAAHDSICVLGTLMQGSAAFEYSHRTGSSSGIVPLWVSSYCVRQQLLTVLTHANQQGSQLNVKCTWLCSVITQQRCMDACIDQPQPPFLYKLIGGKSSKHTRFDDSEDDQDDDSISSTNNDNSSEQNEPMGRYGTVTTPPMTLKENEMDKPHAPMNELETNQFCDLDNQEVSAIAHEDIDAIFADADACNDRVIEAIQKPVNLLQKQVICLGELIKYQQLLLCQSPCWSRIKSLAADCDHARDFDSFNSLFIHPHTLQYVLNLNSSQRCALLSCLNGCLVLHEPPCSFHNSLPIEDIVSQANAAVVNPIPDIEFRSGELKCIQGPPGCGKTRFLTSLLHVLVHCLSILRYHEANLSVVARKSKPVVPSRGRNGLRTCGHRVMVTAASNKAVSVLVEEYLQSSSTLNQWRSIREQCTSLGRNCSVHQLTRMSEMCMFGDVYGTDVVLIGVEDANNLSDGQSCALSISGQLTVVKEYCELLSNTSADVTLTEPTAVIDRVQKFCAPSCPADVYIYTYCQRVCSSLVAVQLSLDACVMFMSKVLAPHPHCLTALKAAFVHFTLINRKLARNLGSLYIKSFDNTATILMLKFTVLLTAMELYDGGIGRDSNGVVTLWIEQVNEVLKYLAIMIQFFHRDSKYESMILESVLSSADVVFCTLSTAGCSLVRRQLIGCDILLVDEASQASEGELLIPCLLQPQNLLLVGDPNQLPPTILSQENLRAGWNISTMERLMIRGKYPYILLNEQYRMHPAISRFPNQMFYQSQICDAPYVCADRRLIRGTNRIDPVCDVISSLMNNSVNGHKLNAGCGLAWLTSPFLFLHVTGTESSSALNRSTSNKHAKTNSTKSNTSGQHANSSVGSICNVAEAKYISLLCCCLYEAMYPCIVKHADMDVNMTSHWPQIRVLTFYAAQVSAIQSELRSRIATTPIHNERLRKYLAMINVHTVDSFQGSETDIILLSFVRSNIAHRVGFIRHFQRLNVALTRAKYMLMCVGNADTLGGIGSRSNDTDALAQLVEYVKQYQLLIKDSVL